MMAVDILPRAKVGASTALQEKVSVLAKDR